MIANRTILLVSVALVGCASNSGVVPMGADTYMVSRQAASGFTGMGTLKAEAMREAYATCQQTGKAVQVVETIDAKPPYIFGNFPKTEIRFRCVSETGGSVGGSTSITVPTAASDAQMTSPTEQATQSSDLYDQLLKLDDLRKRGLLTDEEFNAEKQKLLSKQ
jgi:hypothetical protein